MASKNTARSDSCPVNHNENQESCPANHSSRDVWLKNNSPGAIPSSAQPITLSTAEGLGKKREISSIPRADSIAAYNGGEGGHGGAVKGSSNWVYPSEEMFFNAMKRKNWDPNAKDMKSVVPIHNAVNERAWMEILKWESTTDAGKCGGPKLVSFSGDSSKVTPKARVNMLFGYQRPFDRHDWVVDRCGKKVEYVIDFYSGKPNPLIPDIPSFYLDVRPKLTAEGAWMRFQKFVGLT
ncbi:cytochrome c/c1 heme-lyase [Lipomyces arxii]|uniref:cytochrome c/c1 heme-lyase n=1 Tax=Lipomyces arxii TaxID=56418 RepID=UPI0034CE56FF